MCRRHRHANARTRSEVQIRLPALCHWPAPTTEDDHGLRHAEGQDSERAPSAVGHPAPRPATGAAMAEQVGLEVRGTGRSAQVLRAAAVSRHCGLGRAARGRRAVGERRRPDRSACERPYGKSGATIRPKPHATDSSGPFALLRGIDQRRRAESRPAARWRFWTPWATRQSPLPFPGKSDGCPPREAAAPRSTEKDREH